MPYNTTMMRPAIRRLPLSTLLAMSTAGLLLAALVAMVGITVALLQRLADAQMREATRLATVSAERNLLSVADGLAADGAVLASRPTLQQLAADDDDAGLAAFLTTFQQESRLSACVVLREGRRAVWGGSPLVLPADATPGQTRLVADPMGGAPILLHWVELPGLTRVWIVVALQIDARLMGQISAQVGMGASLSLAESLGDQERALLRGEPPIIARLEGPARYVGLVPLPFADGAPIWLQVSGPTDRADRIVADLAQMLLLITGAVTVAVVLAGLLLGRRISRPLHRLSAAAARIGQGDLATPIEPAAGAEIDALATTLDQMRQRLRQLTDDLREQQAEASAIVANVSEGIFSVDHERRIRYLNPQAAALLGVIPETVIGRFCGDVLYAQDRAGRPCDTACPILAAQSQRSAQAVEHLAPAHSPRRTVVITSAVAESERRIQLIRDETAIEAARRARDAILANISHEFRTPLSAQLASIELLLDRLQDLDPEEIARLVTSLQRGTVRLVRLVDNLLESVRIESGQRSIRQQPLDIDDVVEEALEFVRPLLSQRGQEVQVDLPYPLPPLLGDSSRLVQVLVNLLANANKFAPTGSTISIGAAVAAAGVDLWVQDQGPGLPDAPNNALFERFVRSSGPEPPQTGMGLGLWIAHSIVERHGGALTAERIGQATRFVIHLPYMQESPDEDPDR